MNASCQTILVEVIRRIRQQLRFSSTAAVSYSPPKLDDLLPDLRLDQKTCLLSLPTGRLALGDPYDPGSIETLADQLSPRGDAPVYALLADLEGPRVAAVIVNLDLAYSQGDIKPDLQVVRFSVGGQMFSVDRALGCLLDDRALLAARQDHNFCGTIERAFGSTHFDDFAYRRKHIVGFSTGMGDGQYTAYWVLDDLDAKLALVVDLGIIDRLVPVRGGYR